MSEEINYKKLNFKCGLEIHQQLDADGKKLFCDCPAILMNGEPDFYVERRLHAVAGESGEIDSAAKYQAGLKNTFIYQGHKENSCLIELDEEPPHEINEESLKVAIQIALLMNMKIMPIVQIMRKTVIDGSNTSGFQRTVMIAREGYIETSYGRVGIEVLLLEEDSARKSKVEGGKIYWNLDRLGFPLVEIATAPDINSAEMAKEAALKIGDILRSCRVRRGIGTIRQDVNLSIRGENRVELKGVQDMKMFLETIKNEIVRQKILSDKNAPIESEVRNALPDGTSEFLRPMPGADRMYPETDLPLLKISRDFINECKKDLPKLRSDVAGELKEKGLSEEMIKLLLKMDRVDDFKNLLNFYDNIGFVSKMMLLFPKEIASKEGRSLEEVEEVLESYYADILNLIRDKRVNESDVKDILIKLVKGEDFEKAVSIERKDISEIEGKILKMIKEKPGLNANAYMGLVMKEFKGQVNAREVMEIIGKLLK